MLALQQFVALAGLFNMLTSCKKHSDSEYHCEQDSSSGSAVDLTYKEHDAIAGVSAVIFMVQVLGLFAFPLKLHLEKN